METSLRANASIRNQLEIRDKIDIFRKCSATFGNGHAAPIPPTPVIAPRPGLLANTTASSCATNMSCAAVPAPPRARTFGRLIATFSSRKSAGSSTGSVSLAIFHEPDGTRSRARARGGKIRFPARNDRGSREQPAHVAVQIFLRRARRTVVSTDLRAAGILHHADRAWDSPAPRRRNGEGIGRTDRIDRSRHGRRNEDANSSRRTERAGRLHSDRHLAGAAPELDGTLSQNLSAVGNPAGLRGLPRAFRAAAAAKTIFAQRRLLSRVDHR